MPLHSLSRRDLLKGASSGFGYLAFCGISAFAAAREQRPLAPKRPHHEAKAKRVIFLCMEGGPSHLDTFDYKPRLERDHDKPVGKGPYGSLKFMKSPWKFS